MNFNSLTVEKNGGVGKKRHALSLKRKFDVTVAAEKFPALKKV